VADYTGVEPEYGMLADFDRFLDGAHRRGMYVILDLVLNHTSDRHPWFGESRSSRDNPKRDWYIWRSEKDGGPPNNWYSAFGGPAWEYDPATDQYYYHFFFKEQPDLNWRNPEVRQALWSAARFWLDRGVDGFRLDAIGTIFEDPNLPNHPVQKTLFELYFGWATATTDEERKLLAEQQEAVFQYQVDLPEVQDLMRELRNVVDEYPDRMLVGETELICYYGNGNDQLHMAFNFPLMHTRRLTPAWIRANQKERLTALPAGAWPCNTLGNHDSPRTYSQFGGGQRDADLARLHLALMLTLRGTPFLYNGEEIGMTNLALSDPNLFRDNLSVWVYKTTVEFGVAPAEAAALSAQHGRDKCRTPMQWANVANAGFSPAGVRTWLPVNPNYTQGVNVADQMNDPGSLLNFYKRMLRLRKQTPALIAGDYTPLHEGAEDYFAFLRHSEEDEQTCLVVLNLSDRPHTLNLDLKSPRSHCLFSTRERPEDTDDLAGLKVSPFEVYIGELA
jgi:alpha-glucosidase